MNSNILICVNVFVVALTFIIMLFGHPEWTYQITREGALIENITALCFAAGTIFSFMLYLKKKKILLTVFWCFCCIVFLGEETSWFQHTIGYSIPAIESINAQREVNIHNINIFQGDNIMQPRGKYASFLNSQNLFRLGFFMYFFILPFMVSNALVNKYVGKTGYKPPDLKFTLSVILAICLSFALVFFVDNQTKNELAEAREMLYSYFIMTYIFFYISPMTFETVMYGNEKTI